MLLERSTLFKSKKEFGSFLLIISVIFIYATLIEYNNYKNLTQFDSAIISATILKQYTKTKQTKKGNTRTYQVLKLKSDNGYKFYTTRGMKFPNSKGKKITLEIWAGDISFYQYITIFYARSVVINVDSSLTNKQKVNLFIASQHKDEKITNIYQALYTAEPLVYELQRRFSYLGISHLFAISGFHLGVLSGLLFFIFKYPYKFLQNKLFPYRSYKVDSFMVIAFFLFIYLLFLESPPSLLRAFVMLIIGFIIYDRGLKVISIWTLLLTILLILSLFPRLILSLGFWLSVIGVYNIFLFLIYFKHLNKFLQFILIPIWVYLLMLPYSLYIFSNFSIYHPLSIIWTSLFTIFYPLSIFFHIMGFGDIFDGILGNFINLQIDKLSISFGVWWMIGDLVLLLLSMWKKVFLIMVLIYSILIFIYAVNQF